MHHILRVVTSHQLGMNNVSDLVRYPGTSSAAFSSLPRISLRGYDLGLVLNFRPFFGVAQLVRRVA